LLAKCVIFFSHPGEIASSIPVKWSTNFTGQEFHRAGRAHGDTEIKIAIKATQG